MIQKVHLKIFTLVLFLFLCHCGSDSESGFFSQLTAIAVDSTNDRLFLSEPEKKLFAFTASTLTEIGDQPIITSDRNASLQSLLPLVVSKMVAFSTGTTSRLFFMGTFADGSGNLVRNRIRVIDFDGTSFSEATFSPIVLSDGDDTTTETENSFADLLIDQDGGYLFITDASGSLLYVLNATDGSTVMNPITILGAPQGMSLDNERLYVCNSSTTDTEQVITVMNVSDFTTTTIDLDIPCRLISVQSNSSGTILATKHASTQQVLLRQVDTTSFATSAEIPSATSGIANGSLSANAGISSSVESILSVLKDDIIYTYTAEQDGTVQKTTYTSDLASFSTEALTSTATNPSEGGRLTNSSGQTSVVFFSANSGDLLSLDANATSVTTTD